MAGNIKKNADVHILGKTKIQTVPNAQGTVITYNQVTEEISTRTDAEIISDLGLATTSNLSNYIPTTGTISGKEISGWLEFQASNYSTGLRKAAGIDGAIACEIVMFDDSGVVLNTETINNRSNLTVNPLFFSVYVNDINTTEYSTLTFDLDGFYGNSIFTPSSDNHFIQKGYLTSTLGNYVPLTGTNELSGEITTPSYSFAAGTRSDYQGFITIQDVNNSNFGTSFYLTANAEEGFSVEHRNATYDHSLAIWADRIRFFATDFSTSTSKVIEFSINNGLVGEDYYFPASDSTYVQRKYITDNYASISSLGNYHNIDSAAGISNGSGARANKTWFDYTWAGLASTAGSVINFSGLSGDYSVELFGEYYSDRFGLRSHNGDNGTWNPVRWLWHSGNFNPNNYVDKTSAQDITGYKTFFSYLGGDVADNRLWVRSSDGSNPGMSFIRDGVGNGQIIYNGEVFAFLNTNSSGYVSVVADGFNKAGSSNSYVLTGGGGHRIIDDFVTNDSWNNITGKKWFKTDGGNTWDNNTVRIQGINGYDAGLTFFRDGVDTAQIIFNGYHFNLTNSDNTGFKQIKTAGFIKDGSDVNHVLLGNGDHKLVSDFASSTDLSGYVTLATDQNNITGQKTFSTGYNTYTEDGLFNINAKPLRTDTPSSNRILLGYRDYGGGQYYPRIGFKNDALLTNWSFGLNGNDVTLGINNSASTDIFTFSPNGNFSINGNNVWHSGNLEDYHNYGLGRDIPVPTPDLNLVNTTSIQDITDITLNRPFDYGSVWTHKKNGAEYTQMAVNVLDGRLYTRGQYSAGYTGWQRMALYSELSWKANALENATGIGFSASDYPTNDGVAFPYIYHNNAGSNTPYVALATQAYVQNTFATIGSLNNKVDKSGDTMTGDLHALNITAQNAADTLTYDNLVNYGSPLRINANASLGIYLQADGTDILYVGPSVIQAYKNLAVTGNVVATNVIKADNYFSGTNFYSDNLNGSQVFNASSANILYFGNPNVGNVHYESLSTHRFYVNGNVIATINSGGLAVTGALSLNGQDVATQPWVNANYTPISHVGSGGTAHANATTSTAGFMSSADKTKLDNINTSNFVTINTTQTVTGSKNFADGSQVQFLGGDGNHIIPQRIPGGSGTIVSGHDYTHYNTRWRVGNVRGGSTDSTALGFLFSSDNGSTFSNRVSIDAGNGQINTAIHGNSAEWNDIAQNGLRKGNTGFEYLEDYREIDNNTFDANQPSVKKYILVFDSSSNGHVKISNMVNSQEYQIMNVSPLNSIEIEVDGYGVIDSIDPGKFYNYISHSGGHFSRLNADGTISVLI